MSAKKKEIAIHVLQEVFQDKMLKQAITNLSLWSAQITGSPGTKISFTFSAGAVMAQGKGWQLNIDNISSLKLEKQKYESLMKIIEKSIQLKTGKKS